MVMNNTEALSAGLAAMDAGNKREARRFLGDAVRLNPDDVDAWWHLASVMGNPAQKAHCLRQVLRLQPNHETAEELLRDTERRITSLTPSRGSIRPILDTSAGSKVTSNRVQSGKDRSGSSRNKRTIWVPVTIIGVLVVLVITSIIVLPKGNLTVDLFRPTQQPIQARIGIPSCTAGDTVETRLIFANQTIRPVQLFRGDPDHEEFLGSIAPGSELSIEATSGLRVRYGVRTKAMILTEGAVLEIPSSNICRVPIIE